MSSLKSRKAKSRTARGTVSATSVSLAIVTVALLAIWMLASPAAAHAAPEYRSLSGADRYETAIMVSQAGFGAGVGAVVLATGENYPDALSAAPLAAAYGGPVLLTHSNEFDEETRAEVARLQPARSSWWGSRRSWSIKSRPPSGSGRGAGGYRSPHRARPL